MRQQAQGNLGGGHPRQGGAPPDLRLPGSDLRQGLCFRRLVVQDGKGAFGRYRKGAGVFGKEPAGLRLEGGYQKVFRQRGSGCASRGGFPESPMPAGALAHSGGRGQLSESAERERAFIGLPASQVGMPIGNLTSQIFANIYLNELDRFVKHGLKVKHYLRYGDDFILIHPDLEKLREMRNRTLRFIGDALRLRINPKHDRIIKARAGLRFLGVVIYPGQRRLNGRNERRMVRMLGHRNASSYFGLVAKHGFRKSKNKLAWLIHGLIYPKN